MAASVSPDLNAAAPAGLSVSLRGVTKVYDNGLRALGPALATESEEDECRSALPRAHDSERSSRSRSPSSFIFSCNPLREIFNKRAACVTLLDV